ncbi:MAG: hypothetical protein HRU09_17335 [Oligoflexales bacterium]|nr:hypothetical protein [Oligoflexales bacterium]
MFKYKNKIITVIILVMLASQFTSLFAQSSCLEMFENRDIQKSKNLFRKEAGKFALTTTTIVVGTAVAAATMGGAVPVVIGSVAVIIVDIGLGTTTGKHMYTWGQQSHNDLKMYMVVRSVHKFLLDEDRGVSFKKFYHKHRFSELGIHISDAANAIQEFNEVNFGMCKLLNANNGSAAELTMNGKPFFIFYPEDIFVANLKAALLPPPMF